MEINKRRTAGDKLKKYCYLTKDDEYIEVTEWTNGEGYDIGIFGESKDKFISLTHGEVKAISYLIKSLQYMEEDKDEN